MPRFVTSILFLCGLVLIGSMASAQGVYVNGMPVGPARLQALQQRLGIPPGPSIPAGRYWYDPYSGLWGLEGGPALGQIYANLNLGGPLQSDASRGSTGVFINGRQIHRQEAAYLQKLFGYVIPGRYWLNAQGIGGAEGGPAQFSIPAAIKASGSGQGLYGGYTRRTPFGGTGGDSNCFYYLHPGGSSVMTCQ